MDEILASIFRNQWMVIIIVALLLFLCAEVGFRGGLRLYIAKDDQRITQIGGIQGAVLGMFGLLLGFTFSMAVGRYENRRDLVLQEANSIGTTYLRAAFLPQTHKTAVEAKLLRYVDVRLDFYNVGTDQTKIAAVENETAALQRELWAHTVAVAKEAPTPITATFINSLNETIDLDATRLNALRSRVPAAVWLLVLIIAGASCYASGYGAGASGGEGHSFERAASFADRGAHHPRLRLRPTAARADRYQSTASNRSQGQHFQSETQPLIPMTRKGSLDLVSPPMVTFSGASSRVF